MVSVTFSFCSFPKISRFPAESALTIECTCGVSIWERSIALAPSSLTVQLSNAAGANVPPPFTVRFPTLLIPRIPV